MKNKLLIILSRFCRYGVLHREEVKNDLGTVNKLIKQRIVQKVYRKGKVFYELTENSIPILELQRKAILGYVNIAALLSRRASVYNKFLEDVRFLDEKDPKAKEFQFLGDWQLKTPVVPSQLKLSKYRFYRSRGLV